MFVVAVTGGIGSGKSTVVNLFQQKGVPVIDTDVIARQVIQDNTVIKQLTDAFGMGILNQDDSLNRANLRATAFQNDQNRAKLDRILHPLIFKLALTQLSAARGPYCLLVIPLLYESRYPYQYDRVLVIDIDEQKQRDRAIQRDQTNLADIQKIIAAQASRPQRLSIAGDIIDNNGEIGQLVPQVDALHTQYLALAEQNPPRGNSLSAD